MMQSTTTRSLLLAMMLIMSKTDTSFGYQQQPLSRFGLTRHSASSASAAIVTQPLSPSTMKGWSRNTMLFSTETSNDAAFSAFADALEDGEQQDERQAPSSPSSSSTAQKTKSWQAKLEDLLDPATNMADRQMLLSELLNSNQAIRESVLDALAKREIDPLLTPKQKKLQEGTRAVARQLANDILPSLTNGRQKNTRRETNSPLPSFPVPPVPSVSSLEKVGSRIFNVISNQVQTNLENLQQDLSDPLNRIPQRLSQQTEELVNEVQNVFLETPQGLTEPPYTVVDSSSDVYEIREYEGYTVASTLIEGFAAEDEDGTISGSNESNLLGMGSAFNALAAYLLGANQDKKSMAMTTPVTTTSLGEMRFYLAEPSTGIPKPRKSADQPEIQIVDIPPARLAVRKFTGFVTDGEVARQKDTLLSALEMDGVELDVDHGAIVPHVIFQYNPPYTLPMVRRNEIAIPVRPADVEGRTSLKEEWSVDGEDDSDDVASVMENINGSADDISPSD